MVETMVADSVERKDISTVEKKVDATVGLKAILSVVRRAVL